MTKHDEQFKLKVVQEYLKGTIGSKALARKYGCQASCVEGWVSINRVHGMEGLRKKYSSYSAEFKLSVL